MTESKKTKAELEADVARYEATIGKHQQKMARASQLIKDAKAALKSLDLVPEPPNTVEAVRFTKLFGESREYQYAAIAYRLHGPDCPHRLWNVTGRNELVGVPWEKLAEFVSKDETTRPKVTWLAPSLGQSIAELGVSMQARKTVAEAAAFAVQQSCKPYVYGGM